jgi:Leucine-rich repeat (LRR) protein
MSQPKQNRYPGAQPFSTEQQHIFFGRDDDVARLHRLIKTEPLVVLYAKSGMGKSSLLNAGIVPAVLREGDYTPLHIRFNAWTEGKTDTPADIARSAISPEGSQTTFLDSLIENELSLWHELKENQLLSGGQRKYLLVFDQFEELFTYPPEAIAAFREQMAEALYTKIPQRYRRVLEGQIEVGTCQLHDDEFDRLQEPVQLRIVLSIRSDRMHLMDRLSESLPDILAHCYELDALSADQAAAAVTEPAAQPGDFASPAFGYSHEAVQHILQFLDDSEGRIETVHLQILCRNFEERAAREGIRFFEKNTLGDLEGIIDGFYHRQLDALGTGEARRNARLLIEEGLIVPENSQRLTMHEAQIDSLFRVPREHLSRLVDGGLLRAEPALRGGYAYELSHDTLVVPALKARTERREQEAAEALSQQAKAAAEAIAEERRKRQRSRNAALGLGFLAALAVAAAVFAFFQEKKARAAQAEAERQKTEAQQQRQAALEQKDRADNNQRLAELSAKEALTQQEKAELQRLLAEKAERAARSLAAKGERLETTISGADTYGFLMQSGNGYMKQGDYRNALTYFATARFMGEKPEAERAITTAKTGLEAERHFAEGELERAGAAYRALRRDFPQDTAFVTRRLGEIQTAQRVFEEKTMGKNAADIQTLSLAGQRLATLPAALAGLSNLRELELSRNPQLAQLPSWIGRLKNLRKLIVTDAGLNSLPAELGQLTQLEQLNLVGNGKLTSIPAEIGQLRSLQELNLGGCRITALPSAIGRLSQLRSLNVSSTSLRQLPPELAQLSGLRTLDLSSAPALDFGRSLPLVFRLSGLQNLNLSGSDLAQPELLAGLPNLPNLMSLDLSFNNLKSLPPDLAQLKNLKTLSLKENPIDPTTLAQIRAWLPGCRVDF